MVLKIIQILLVTYGIIAGIIIIKDYIKNREQGVTLRETVLHYIIGVFVNFFDALGIGSFATTTTAYGLFRLVEDRKIPGTLNAGVAIPVIFEALLFTSSVKVEFSTLIPVVISGVVGAALGNKLVAKVKEKTVTMVMAIGLLISALLMLGSKFGILPAGGDAIGLTGIKLMIACVGNFILGVALNFSIGNFTPCMCMVYMLGMSPLVSFPIMMCTGAISTPTTGLMSLKEGLIDRHAVMGLTVGGMFGVAIAVYVVKSMSISTLQWIVIAVVLYTSATMFRRATRKPEKEEKEDNEAKAVFNKAVIEN